MKVKYEKVGVVLWVWILIVFAEVDVEHVCVDGLCQETTQVIGNIAQPHMDCKWNEILPMIANFSRFLEESFEEKVEYYQNIVPHVCLKNTLVGVGDIEFFLTNFKYDKVKFVKDGHTTKVATHIDNNRVKGTVTLHDFRDVLVGGSSVVLNFVHNVFSPIRKLCFEFESKFRMHTGSNLYLTPPNSNAFFAHFDPQSLFIFQLQGTKKWNIYDWTHPLGTSFSQKRAKKYGWEHYEHQLGEPVETFELKAGDILHLPRGVPHKAVSTSDVSSLHLTISVADSWTWAEVIRRIFERYFIEKSHEEKVKVGTPKVGGWRVLELSTQLEGKGESLLLHRSIFPGAFSLDDSVSLHTMSLFDDAVKEYNTKITKQDYFGTIFQENKAKISAKDNKKLVTNPNPSPNPNPNPNHR